MSKTLILDIDNTLIEAMKELQPRSEAALRRWLAAGHRLVFAMIRALLSLNSLSFFSEGSEREQVVTKTSFSSLIRQKSRLLMVFQSSIYFCKVRCIDMRSSLFLL